MILRSVFIRKAEIKDWKTPIIVANTIKVLLAETINFKASFRFTSLKRRKIKKIVIRAKINFFTK